MDQLLPEQEKQVEEAVSEAGEILLSYWPATKGASQPRIQTKPDGSFVSEADLSSNALIISRLHKLFPSDGVLSEELPPDPHLEKFRRVWILDPLDGTHPFLEGKDDFSILLALVVQNKPIYGLMYYPALNLLVRAKKGQGAWLAGQALKVSETKQFRTNSLRVRGLEISHAQNLINHEQDAGPSVLRLIKGELDGIIVKTGKLGEWDVAASTLAIEESGGVVSDENGERLNFNQSKVNYSYFVASNGHLHEQLLALIPPLSI